MIADAFTVLVAFLLFCGEMRAQDSTRSAADPHAVQPERPTVATHAHTVAPGWLEIEAGIERDKLDTALSYPTPIQFKVGLSRSTQLGLVIPHITWQDHLVIGDFALNLKWQLLEDSPLFGDFALVPVIKFPNSYSSTGGPGTFDASLIVVSSYEIEKVSIDLNACYTIRTGEGLYLPKHSSYWTASFGGAAFDKLGWVFELFGFPGTTGRAGLAPTVATLVGPTFSYAPWICFDAGCILKLAGPQPFGLFAGLTWNVGQVFSPP